MMLMISSGDARMAVQVLRADGVRLSLFSLFDRLQASGMTLAGGTRAMIEISAPAFADEPGNVGTVQVFDDYGVLVTGRIASASVEGARVECALEGMSGILVGRSGGTGRASLIFPATTEDGPLVGGYLRDGRAAVCEFRLSWDGTAIEALWCDLSET
jgi:hypothetical protein